MYIAFGNFSGQIVSVVNTVGTTTTTGSSSYMLVNANVGEDTKGIVVGSGSTAVSIDDYKLQTKIVEGSSAGTLQYGSCAISEPSATTTTTQFVVSREFSNETGSPVSINEVGIYAYMNLYSGSNVMFVRDTVSIVLADADHLTFNYIIQTTI
jgi:hypothetical protein